MEDRKAVQIRIDTLVGYIIRNAYLLSGGKVTVKTFQDVVNRYQKDLLEEVEQFRNHAYEEGIKTASKGNVMFDVIIDEVKENRLVEAQIEILKTAILNCAYDRTWFIKQDKWHTARLRKERCNRIYYILEDMITKLEKEKENGMS